MEFSEAVSRPNSRMTAKRAVPFTHHTYIPSLLLIFGRLDTACSPDPNPPPDAAVPAAASLLLSGDARFELPLLAPVLLFVPGIFVAFFVDVPAVLVLGAKKLVIDRCCAPGMMESDRDRGSEFAVQVCR